MPVPPVNRKARDQAAREGDLSSLMDYLSFPKTITPETPNYISFSIFYFFKLFVNL